jgi:hypothetical protein
MLLVDLAHARGAAGEHAPAIADVTTALETGKHADAARVTLLRVRAELRSASGDTAGAVADAEEPVADLGGALLAVRCQRGELVLGEDRAGGHRHNVECIGRRAAVDAAAAVGRRWEAVAMRPRTRAARDRARR